MTVEELSKADMGQLCEALEANELKQAKIYETYRKAAEFELEMRELKRIEKIIRIYMSGKVYS